MNAKIDSLTILVVDDDEDDRDSIRKAWSQSRVAQNLRFLNDGEELTEYLNHTGKYADPASSPRPALILLDLNMPRKDGREALREIKANPELRRIPIIVLTTSQADEDISSSYDLGANSYIAKPVTFAVLVDVLQVLGRYWIEIVKLNTDDDKQSGMETPGNNVNL
ncbi:MAG: response regulator [Acidobacteriota bacterium]